MKSLHKSSAEEIPPSSKSQALLLTIFSTIILLLIWPLIFPQLTPVITIRDGSVQGRTGKSRNGEEYWEFLSIPYAKPPLGKLRFEPPEKIKPWKGVKRTVKHPPYCLQFDPLVTRTAYGEEDCLFLNVFTHPIQNETTLRPVLVYIHGGGFVLGGSRVYGAEYFMDHGVVIVTFNYRLGPFGFLNFNEPGLPRGNMGMKDQLLVLHWVQDNIEYFGGDPGRVTIYGDSAGGASVNFHVLSSKSKGLFHRAISQSGSALVPWGFTKEPRKMAYEYVKRWKCPDDNPKDLLECLENYDPLELVKQQLSSTDPFLMADNLSPSVEGIASDDMFLDEDPSEIVKNREIPKIPYLFGVNSGEGVIRTAKFDTIPSRVASLQSNWSELIGNTILMGGLSKSSALRIKDEYFPSSDNLSFADPERFKDRLTHLFSDALIIMPVTKSAVLHASNGGPTFMFYYNYTPSFLPGVYSLLKACTPNDWLPCDVNMVTMTLFDWIAEHIFGQSGAHQYQVVHSEEILQLWNINGLSKYFSFMETKFSEDFVKIFVHFMNGKKLLFRKASWPPLDPNQLRMMLLDSSERADVISPPYLKKIRFWETIQQESE